MAVTLYTADDVQVVVKEQATWGTAESTLTDGIAMQCETTAIEHMTNVRETNRSHASQRVPNAADVIIDEDLTLQKITITGQVVKDDISDFLYALYQSVTESATTPYQKDFVFGTSQPVFTSGAGYFATIFVDPVAGNGRMIHDAICSSLTLSCDPTSNGGRLYYSADWIGRGGLDRANTPSGSATARAQDYFDFSDIGVHTLGGTSYSPAGFSLTMTNGAIGVGVDSAAFTKFHSYALRRYGLTGNIKAFWETGMESLAVDATNAWVISWGADGSDGYFMIQLDAKHTAMNVEDGDIRVMDYALTGVKSTTSVVRVKLADDIDRTW